MKKLFFSLAAVAAIVAGCAKESLETKAVNEDGSYNFKAVIADKSKTTIDENGTMAWVVTDQIDVYDGSFHTFDIQPGFNESEAVFKGDLDNPGAVSLAVCPAGIGAEVADEIVEFNLPSEYAYDGQSTHAVMFATGFGVNDKTNTIKFKHLGGLFKVTYNNVPQSAAAFCFEATKQIAGDFKIDYVNEPVLEVADEESETNNVVSYTIDPDDDHTSMSFYIPVPVGTFGFNICLKDGEGNKIAGSIKTKSEFEIVLADYVNIPAIELPKTLVENFTANVSDKKYDSSKNFTTPGYTSTYDYAWSLTSGSAATVGNNFVKIGKSGAAGSIQNSSMLENIEAGTNFTVSVYAANWPGKTTKVFVEYNGKNQSSDLTSVPSASTNDYSSDDFVKYDFVFQKVEDVNNLVVGGTTERVLVDKLVITEGGELPAEPQEFGVSTTSLAAAWDETSKTFNITAADVVAWEIVADDGLTLSQNEGNGDATITVTFDQNTAETQISKEIVVSTTFSPVVDENTYTITLTQEGKPARQMDGNGTVEKPYSVADALYLIDKLSDGGTSANAVYVSGIIVSESAGIDTEYGNATFQIADSNTSDDELTVFRVKDLSTEDTGAAFTDAEQLKVGDVVVVYAKLKKYVKGSEVTPETDQGKLYSINGHTSILTGITLGEKQTVYFVGDDFVAPTVTASYRGKANATVTAGFTGYNMADVGNYEVTASYTEDGINKTATYNIAVSDNTSYDIEVAVNDNTMGLATVTVGGQAATTAKEGEEVTVTITPNTGYVFSSLTLNGDDKTAEVSANVFTFTMQAAKASINIVFQEPQDEVYFYESFNSCTGSGGNDGQWSGSIASNTLTADNEGWTSANGNGANKCAKFGSGNKKGSAETPEIDVKTATAMLRFKAAAWNGNSEGTTLNVSATNATLAQSSVTLVKGSWTTYTVAVSNVTGQVKIKFEAANASNNRFFLDEVYVYYGAAPATPKDNPTIESTNKSITLSSGQATQDLNEMFDSNSTGSFTYSLKAASTTANISGSTFTATAAGTYTIVANQAATDDYNAGSAEASITVNEESQGDGDYEVDGTLASWTFTSGTAGTNYPSNSTNFNSNGGSDLASGTFYLNGSGSTWNTGAGKGYAFTAVTDVTITIKANKTLKAGAKVTLSMDTFYNKASNAPMTGFNITAKEGSGSFATTGLSVTSWSLSNSSANKSVVYTIQSDIAKDSTVSFKLTQTGKAGAGQGYINNVEAKYSTN